MWAKKLRKLNGPNFTWPIFMFAGVLPETTMAALGKIYVGKPMKIKTRAELIANTKPQYRQYFREDNGDLKQSEMEPQINADRHR